MRVRFFAGFALFAVSSIACGGSSSSDTGATPPTTSPGGGAGGGGGMGEGLPTAGAAGVGGTTPAGGTGGTTGGTGGKSSVVALPPAGSVQGTSDGSVRKYLGIPYATAERWKSPQQVPMWTDTRDATKYGKKCPQYDLGTGTISAGTDEDCLTLNIWTPDPAPVGVPVLFFVHGGAFYNGSGSDALYEGSSLAKASGAVVVTINYRLGPLGFLAHDALDPDAMHKSGNWGLEDQRAALQWVQHNIDAFGGDPSRVMLFGESAGAASACLHMISPPSAGLFSRTLLESGTCELVQTRDKATQQGQSFASALGCTDASTVADCMRGKSTMEVMAALPLNASGFGLTGATWGPVTEDPFNLPMTAKQAYAAGALAKVPMVVGNNANEGTLFLFFAGGAITEQVYETAVQAQAGANAQAVLQQYPSSAYPTPKDALADLIGDAYFLCPSRRLARAATSEGIATFRYHFAHALQVPVLPGLGAFHASEIPFVFGNPFLGTQLDAGETMLSATMQGYWANHAADGDPNGGSAPMWPAYDAATDPYLVLDEPISTAMGLKTAKCDFWDSITP